MRSIRRHKHAMGALLVDFNDAERLSLSEEFSEQIKRYVAMIKVSFSTLAMHCCYYYTQAKIICGA